MRKAHLKKAGKAYLVWVEALKAREGEARPYRGPTAEISHDANWLHITTDAYEGHAMINIEALPMLRRALAGIAQQLKNAS